MFIGGRWVTPQDGETILVVTPADGKGFATIGRGRAHEVDIAVKAC